MKHLLIIVLLVVSACAAEGDLEETDAGANAATNNAQVDAGDGANNSVTDSGNNSAPDAETVLCDPLQPACPDGTKCIPNDLGASSCIPSGEDAAIGESCTRSSDCVEGSACVMAEGESTCRELCDSDDVQSCTVADTYCLQTLGSDPTLGVCAPPPAACSIYDQDCDSGDCVLRRNPADDQIGTFCGTAGEVAIGGPCGGDDGKCVAGAICLTVGEATQATCHQVCRDPDVTCAEGTCSGTSGSGIDFCL